MSKTPQKTPQKTSVRKQDQALTKTRAKSISKVRKKLISIITPVYNEEASINWYYEKIVAATDKLKDRYDFEFILTDNASSDKTVELVEAIIKKDKRFHLYCLSRNYGYQKSILTGYNHAKGDAAIEFDCDLQDPPELLIDFICAWEDGHQIVYGIRAKRKEGKLITLLRKVFYRLINWISDTNLPPDAGDFMLIDRVILDQLQRVDDHNLYIRGIVFGYGYSQLGIVYERKARLHGDSSFPMSKLIALALDGIVSQSTLPLKIASFVGLIVAFLTLLTSLFFIIAKLFFDMNFPQGITITFVLILFSVSLNAIFFGIIGEYLARIYAQIRKRPMTIVSKYVGNNKK